MATEEASCTITDLVSAELVECAPDAADVRVLTATVQETTASSDSPVEQAADATLTQTGADPPPTGVR